jgi:hypothetical protein
LYLRPNRWFTNSVVESILLNLIFGMTRIDWRYAFPPSLLHFVCLPGPKLSNCASGGTKEGVLESVPKIPMVFVLAARESRAVDSRPSRKEKMQGDAESVSGQEPEGLASTARLSLFYSLILAGAKIADTTAIDLFVAGIQGWEAEMRRFSACTTTP